MTNEQFENIANLLKAHYGVTQVNIDNNIITLQGNNIDADAIYVAIVVEYGHLYDISYATKSTDKNCQLLVEKKRPERH